MNNEKKEYSVIGRVEIGTDEYRDLIEGLAAARQAKDRADSDWWKERRRADEAEQNLKEVTAKYNELRDFIESDETVRTKLQLYRVTKNGDMEV